MILVDTAIWVDHLRGSNPILQHLLDDESVLTHPFVIGEIALGSLRQRATVLADLRNLPHANIADDDEVMGFIMRNALFGSGIGYIDAHLLASARLTPETLLWTRDKRLLAVAQKLSLAHSLN